MRLLQSNLLRCLGLTGCVGVVLGLATVAPAVASTTIGQLETNPPVALCASGPDDFLQPTVTSGNPYVVPAGGAMITSWSTNAYSGAGQTLELKVFRKIGNPATYEVVGHDGPHPLKPSTLNTFPAGVPVQPGDVLGLGTQNSGVMEECFKNAPGESFLFRTGALGDGASGEFTADNMDNSRLNVTALVALRPANVFDFGKVKDNKNKGTATLAVNVPGPGALALRGKGVKTQRTDRVAVASKIVTAAGTVKLPIRAKGKVKQKLNKTGKAKVKVKVTYTPSGGDLPGDPNTQTKRLKLVKKLG